MSAPRNIPEGWTPKLPDARDRGIRKGLSIDRLVVLDTADRPAEKDSNFRRAEGGIDYANFPSNASYVSVGDVRSAYSQGLQDASCHVLELELENAELREQIHQLTNPDNEQGEQ